MVIRVSPVSFASCAAAVLILAPACNGDDGGVGDPDGATTSPTGTTTTTNGAPTNGAPTNGDPTHGADTTDGLPGATNGQTDTNGTGPAVGCGNDMIEAGEECDTSDLGGESCSDHGYDGGTLACSSACTFDTSGCHVLEALQNDNGACNFQELGCTDDLGSFGNPQDLLECYESSLNPPLEVIEVQYSIGDSAPLPSALSLVVHEWAGPGNPPGTLIGELELEAETDIVAGMHTLVLPASINVSAASFCVGFHGEDPSEGFRIDFTDADHLGETWVRAAACSAPMFTEASEIQYMGNFCIRPTVISRTP